MKISSNVRGDGTVQLEITGESDHENTLLTLISQKAFEGAYISESAGTNEPARVHMTMCYRNPDPAKPITEESLTLPITQ